MVHIDQEEMAQEKDTRKGPWTEQEDVQLDFFVRLFGERRWDFIAKVSGLNRTGKSCRLRWVNYLHPGLKRGKLSHQEERLVLELHSKWGNRWSRIARKLPGRTDNEIKNYWRTHMRKKAQQRKRNFSSSSSSSFILDSLSSATTPLMDSAPLHSKSERGKKMDNSEYGASSAHVVTGLGGGKEEEANFKAYSMDQIWKEISSTEILSDMGDENFRFDGGTFACPSMAMASPLWDYQYGDQSAWRMDDEELKHWLPTGDHNPSNYQRA